MTWISWNQIVCSPTLKYPTGFSYLTNYNKLYRPQQSALKTLPPQKKNIWVQINGCSLVFNILKAYYSITMYLIIESYCFAITYILFFIFFIILFFYFIYFYFFYFFFIIFLFFFSQYSVQYFQILLLGCLLIFQASSFHFFYCSPKVSTGN